MKYKQSFYNIWQAQKEKVYLLNTYSGSIVSVNKNEIGVVNSILEDKNDIDIVNEEKIKEYIKVLLDNGFLIPEEVNERDSLQYIYKLNYFDSSVLDIVLLPTMRCNFKCPYCYEEEKQMTLTEERLQSLIKFAEKNFINKNRVTIGLFGGEPLLEWKKIKKFFDIVLNLSKKYGFMFAPSITTNAYLFEKDMINDMIDKYHFRSFQISIDGYKTTHNTTRVLIENGKGTYETVLKNFKLLLEKKKQSKKNYSLTLRVNLMNTDEKSILKLFNEFDYNEKELFYIYFRPIYNTKNFCISNSNYKNLESFYSLAIKEGFNVVTPGSNSFTSIQACEGDGGIHQIEIMPNLSIWKCSNNLNCKEANIGEICNDGNIKLFYDRLEKWSKNNPFEYEKCSNCKYLPLCWGSCPLNFLLNKKRNCFYEKDFNLVNLFLNSRIGAS
ncbi:MAG: hypothetical protein CR982_07590 [Candidatus Cloacimonadota bacterium]|nr:MAG: hypothetical protein CR982_07590 [Candidatus Cloacimonadota bacterium]